MTARLTATTEVLETLIADGEREGWGTRYDTDILAALRELKALRQSEFLCSRCLMRDAQDEPPVAF